MRSDKMLCDCDENDMTGCFHCSSIAAIAGAERETRNANTETKTMTDLRPLYGYAIRTRFLPATNTKGARISATLVGAKREARAVIPYDHALSSDMNHATAAHVLIYRRGGVGCADALVDVGGIANGERLYVATNTAGAVVWTS